MQTPQLTENVTESLSRLLQGTATDSQKAMGDRLYSIIQTHFKNSGKGTTFEVFETQPSSPMTRQNFKRILARELEANDQFRLEVVGAGQGYLNRPTVIATSGSTAVGGNSVSASGRGTAAGRDINNTSNRRNYGGIVVALFAAFVVVLVIFFVGRAVIVTVGNVLNASTLNGSSTCADYIGSSDQRQKMQVMKDLYLKLGKTEQAADPFIIQNTEYYCSTPHNQAVTLERIAEKV
jgi:hypothetical protein